MLANYSVIWALRILIAMLILPSQNSQPKKEIILELLFKIPLIVDSNNRILLPAHLLATPRPKFSAELIRR